MIRLSCIALLVCMVLPTMPASADEETVLFAVVSEVPKDKARVSVRAVSDGAVSDLKLLPSEVVQDNLIWRKLEVCHAGESRRNKSRRWVQGYDRSCTRCQHASDGAARICRRLLDQESNRSGAAGGLTGMMNEQC